EKLIDPRELEVQQKSAMKQEKPPVAALGIAGEFPGSDRWRVAGDQRQIGMALDSDGGVRRPASDFRFDRRAISFHDEPVRARDAGERGIFCYLQNERVI